jgi:hypothetical protein
MKPLLIGISSTITTPESSIDHQLWKMLHARTGAIMKDYTENFERRNLVRGSYDRRHFQAGAHRILCDIRDSGRTVILIGKMVREAFNHVTCGALPPVLIHPIQIGGCTWRQIPHVHSRWYKTEENCRVIEMLLEELYDKAKGRLDDYQSA